jgi:hypothetical protein
MRSAETDPSLAAVKPLVAAAKRRLDEDGRRIDKAVLATAPGFHLPAAVFTAIGTARRDALASFARVFAVQPNGATKQLALAWLSLTAAGFGATHDALRAERLAPATAARKRRVARERLARSGIAFLALDRALGCPHGCRRRP